MALIQLFLKYLVGLFLLSFFIWRYLFRIKLPKDLTFEFSWFYVLLAISIIILHIYIIYRKIYPPNPPKNRVIIKLLEITYKINDYVYSVYTEIFSRVIDFYFVKVCLVNIGDFLIMNTGVSFRGKKYFVEKQYLYIFFNVIPRFIVVLCFSLDVCWFNRMEYFYIAVYLLILPLLLNVILFLLPHMAKALQEHVRYYVNVDKILLEPVIDNIQMCYYKFKWKDPNIEQKKELNLPHMENSFMFALDILSGCSEVNKLDEFKKIKLVNIFIHVLYVIAWGYTLFKVCFSLISLLICIYIFFTIF